MACREDVYGEGFWVWVIRKCLVDGNLREKKKVYYEKRNRKKNGKQLQMKKTWWKERDEVKCCL